MIESGSWAAISRGRGTVPGEGDAFNVAIFCEHILCSVVGNMLTIRQGVGGGGGGSETLFHKVTVYLMF